MIRLPKVAVLEITYRCNHRCLFCYCPWEHEKELLGAECPTGEWKQILTALSACGVHRVTFSGGEPLLRADFMELLPFAVEEGMAVGVITNGLALTDAMLRDMRLLNVQLSVSVPGIDTYAALTGVDHVAETLTLIERASGMGIATTANVTVTKMNLPELYENIALPLLSGADTLLLNRFTPGGRGLEHRELLLDPAELNQALQIAEEVLDKAGARGHVGTELPLCVVERPEQYQRLQISYYNEFTLTSSKERISEWRRSVESEAFRNRRAGCVRLSGLYIKPLAALI